MNLHNQIILALLIALIPNNLLSNLVKLSVCYNKTKTSILAFEIGKKSKKSSIVLNSCSLNSNMSNKEVLETISNESQKLAHKKLLQKSVLETEMSVIEEKQLLKPVQIALGCLHRITPVIISFLLKWPTTALLQRQPSTKHSGSIIISLINGMVFSGSLIAICSYLCSIYSPTTVQESELEKIKKDLKFLQKIMFYKDKNIENLMEYIHVQDL